MQKHLIWLPWVMGALVLGILVCVGLIIRMLFFQPQPVFHSGVQLVKEAVCRALA